MTILVARLKTVEHAEEHVDERYTYRYDGNNPIMVSLDQYYEQSGTREEEYASSSSGFDSSSSSSGESRYEYMIRYEYDAPGTPPHTLEAWARSSSNGQGSSSSPGGGNSMSEWSEWYADQLLNITTSTYYYHWENYANGALVNDYYDDEYEFRGFEMTPDVHNKHPGPREASPSAWVDPFLGSDAGPSVPVAPTVPEPAEAPAPSAAPAEALPKTGQQVPEKPTNYEKPDPTLGSTWLAALKGFGRGLLQSAANGVNGLQDGVIFVPNAFIGLMNAHNYMNPSVQDGDAIPYIPSPDWSRGLFTHESGEPGAWNDSHGWSKFVLGGAGGYGVLKAGNAVKNWWKATPITVYRVEGPGNTRIFVAPNGNVTIPDHGKMLHLNFGQEQRAKDFLQQRLGQFPDDTIKTFDVPQDVLDQIRKDAVPQIEGKMPGNIGKPQIDDATKAVDQYGLPPKYIKLVEDNIIPGTGQ